MIQANEIMNIIRDNLSNESQWILFTLKGAKSPLRKELLWEQTNEIHSKFKKDDEKSLQTNNKDEKLLSSRYVLDIHTARLEGAGLVEVEVLGRVRLYKITNWGKEFLEYIKNN